MFDIHLPKKLEEKKDEITLLNYYGKYKEFTANFYKLKQKEVTHDEKGTTTAVMKYSDDKKKK